MFPTINAEYLAAKRADAANQFILESVLDVDETLPGSDEELENLVDPDSVPEDVYAKLDKELDKIVEDPNYDDTEAEEMLDDDFDVDDISDAELDAIVDEAVNMMDRKAKIAGVFANLSEKAGNNMANNTGMGLLKVLSEAASVNQFQNGKMSDPIGQAYEPVETPQGAKDEVKLENEALRESAVDAALARFHSLMEGSNPDVEDFPGKEGTTKADGETPAGMPEPNGNEDGSNVGGDDQVVDREAKEVKVEDGGDDAIEVIKANETVNKYLAIVEAAKAKAAGKEVCPTCGKADCVCEAPKNESVDAEGEGVTESVESVNESLENAKNRLNDAKIFRDRAKTYSNTARQALNNNWTNNGGPNGQLPKGKNTISSVSVTGNDSLATTENMKKAAKFNNVEAIKQLGAAAKEAATDKNVQAKATKAANAALVAGAVGVAGKKLLDARKAKKAAAAEEEKKSLKEAVTNQDVEDFPNQTGAGNDHGEKEGALPEGEEPADFPNSTGDKKVNSGDAPTNRYKTVAEAVTNPDVEDFPVKEGTDAAEGEKAPAKMEHEDTSVQPAYTDESDFEQKEVGVEDGGTDVIEVIKANENVVLESAREKLKDYKAYCADRANKRAEARDEIRTSVTKARKELEDEAPDKGVIAKYKHAQKVDARAHEIRRDARKKLTANGGSEWASHIGRYDHPIKDEK